VTRQLNSDDWPSGYTEDQLDDIQSQFDLTFPPDLSELLLTKRPPEFYHWIEQKEEISKMLNWPGEGVLFDVEENGLWWPEWDECPQKKEDRAKVIASVISKAPKLIPLYSHRYIPEEPSEGGNPVYSIYQSDVIYYGRNLSNYLLNEFGYGAQKGENELLPIKEIPFWHHMVIRNGNPKYFPFAEEP